MLYAGGEGEDEWVLGQAQHSCERGRYGLEGIVRGLRDAPVCEAGMGGKVWVGDKESKRVRRRGRMGCIASGFMVVFFRRGVLLYLL